MVITYGIIIVPTIFFLVNVAVKLDLSVVVIGCITCTILLVAYSTAACSDPGIVFRYTEDIELCRVINQPQQASCSVHPQRQQPEPQPTPESVSGHYPDEERGENGNALIQDKQPPYKNNEGDLNISEHIEDDRDSSASASPIMNQHVANSNNFNSSYMECSQCHIDRPRHASHCYQCGVCIEDVSRVSL